MAWLFTPIDHYCERLHPGLLAEPLNAISNAAFFLAAYALWKACKRLSPHAWEMKLLIFLVATIGLGSTLFHTFANRLTMLMDVIPIAVFLSGYIVIFLLRIVKCQIVAALAGGFAFFMVSQATWYTPPEYQFNGSIGYMPALAAMILITLFMLRSKGAAFYLGGLSAFTVSLTLRTLDMQLCGAFPVGTHFLWHGFNGLAIYLFVRPLLNAAATPCTVHR